jgi:hypothetical protein
MNDEQDQNDKLTVWTIYKSPLDYPGKWVLRGHDVPGGPRLEHFVGSSLGEVRAHLPFGLFHLSRDPNDDPTIYETWL